MNILPIIPNLYNKNSKIKNANMNNSAVIHPKYDNALATDTISFKAKAHEIGTGSKVSDHLEAQVAADFDRLSRIATTYLDVLESVAFRLKDNGFSFDRAYCEQNPVKSPKSYTSKVMRSGNFKVPDTIRATLYCNNAYDLSALNLLLDEMKKRGYVVADTEMSVKDLMKRGYKPNSKEAANTSLVKTVPDLDMRLEDVSDQISKLEPKFKYSVGKPQKSGYEDIQMRFVREFDKKKNPVLHELIILFGPNYSMAKHEESEKVYSHLRLFDELNMKFEDNTIGSHSNKANRYIELIRQMFRGKVSEKLFLNAKNNDLYEISDEIPISFSDTDIHMLENYFSGLNDRLNSCYKDAKKGAAPSALATRQINSDLRHDRTLLIKTKENLRKTIEYYNNKNALNETKD